MPTNRDRLFELVSEAVSRDPNTPTPLRPVKDLEDITIRQVHIASTTGQQDITLYPEDDFLIDPETGDITINLKTIGNGNGWVYATRAQLGILSYAEYPHKRERGTLRPDPKKVFKDFEEQEMRERAERIAARAREELGGK